MLPPTPYSTHQFIFDFSPYGPMPPGAPITPTAEQNTGVRYVRARALSTPYNGRQPMSDYVAILGGDESNSPAPAGSSFLDRGGWLLIPLGLIVALPLLGKLGDRLGF